MATRKRRGKTEKVSVSIDRADLAVLRAALAALPAATTVDAIVMASAARRGDVVLTSDFDELDRLRAHFPGVRLLTI